MAANTTQAIDATMQAMPNQRRSIKAAQHNKAIAATTTYKPLPSLRDEVPAIPVSTKPQTRTAKQS
jgi:hypothetical protein